MTDRDRKALEHDAILAELAALGEEPMEDDELTDAEGMAVAFDVLHGRAVSAVPAEASEQAFEGARLLLGGSEASALDGRSAALWGAVAARVAAPARSPDDELRTLGEASLVAGEADAAAVVAHVTDGVLGQQALPAASLGASLPTAEAIAGLQLLQAASPAAELTAARAAVLYQGVAAQVGRTSSGAGGNVVPLRRAWPWQGVIAAAAAVLMMLGVGLAVSQWPSPEPLPMAVAQIELDAAERHLGDVERTSLQALVGSSEAPTGEAGDHFLRPLREARSQAMMARVQARERRL